MRISVVVLGVLILAAGVGIAAYYGFVPRTRVYGGYGIAVIGVIIALAGAMMGSAAAVTKGQFTCQQCGATFGSQGALDQHSRDKHRIQSPNPPS